MIVKKRSANETLLQLKGLYLEEDLLNCEYKITLAQNLMDKSEVLESRLTELHYKLRNIEYMKQWIIDDIKEYESEV